MAPAMRMITITTVTPTPLNPRRRLPHVAAAGALPPSR
ncbi:hypothetical protein FHX62_001521 [Cupriavidus alkaliphilus]|nr:hypothetical protein [Cupriavidus alkaliphilus]MBB3012861.1 hypothetical protein [Cupriavidus alkaliphilus]